MSQIKPRPKSMQDIIAAIADSGSACVPGAGSVTATVLLAALAGNGIWWLSFGIAQLVVGS